MKIHLKQIPAEGLHLEGEENCPIPELVKDGIRCVGPLKYNIDVGVSSDALWANGSLVQSVEVTCVSCLEKFVHDVNVPSFAVHTELGGPETVDLTPFIREDVMLNLPPYPHCDANGQRTCRKPAMLSANGDQEEQEAKREHDWEALDKLKIRKT